MEYKLLDWRNETMNIPFNAEERRSFLREYFELYEKNLNLEYQLVTSEGEASNELVNEADEIREKLSQMRDDYRSSVPVLPMSRCPYTNQVVYHSIDHYGLDGLWWNSNVPIRPVEVLPSSFFMLKGAVKLGRIENTPFPVKPGPEVPYVIPEVLALPQFKAVISRIRVGEHTAYSIFYFIEDWERAIEPMNNWGTKYWSFLDADMKLGYHEYGVYPEEEEPDYSEEPVTEDTEEDIEYTYDFELSKYIEKGKLLWIEPDDPTFYLKTGTSGCPYLNLEGSREFPVIFEGEIVTPEEEEYKNGK
ncbi:hypothetical protein GF395_04490 [Candidatus Uhrbacteria bacterium]|nr:hypothetical protein [Candidatus Uhrbacteria bacterium]